MPNSTLRARAIFCAVNSVNDPRADTQTPADDRESQLFAANLAEYSRVYERRYDGIRFVFRRAENPKE